MDKNWYESKTMWGFGLLAISIAGNVLGAIPVNEVTTLLDVAFGLLGVYGIRDALG